MTEQTHDQRSGMVVTVGTGTAGGPDSLAAALAWSIDQSGVDAVTFVVTPESTRTAQKVKEIMAADYPASNARISWETVGPLQTMEDVNVIFGFCLEAIRGLEELGIDRPQVIVNYTSGTKAMSAAAALAGSSLGCRLVYVSGEREAGIVKPGTEVSFAAPPNAFQAFHDLQLARRMVQRLQFQAAMELCNDVAREHLSAQDERYRRNLYRLARAYDAWEKFDHAEAAKLFGRIEDGLDALDELRPDAATIERLRSLGAGDEQPSSYSPELIADLLANAARRIAPEGKWDDAVARLYRAVEMTAQYVLWRDYRIDTGAIQQAPLGAHDERRQARIRELIGSRDDIGLRQAYALLEILDDQLGPALASSGVSGRLQQRNLSILAHGVTPVSQREATRFQRAVLQLVTVAIPDIDRLVSEQQFPWLRE